MATSKKLETPVFTIEDGTVTKEAAGTRTLLRFAAEARRHIDGCFSVGNVYAHLFDREGRFIAKRGADSARTVLANRAGWLHEIANDQLATAARLVYEIEYRFDVRRKLVAGELPALPAESDGSDYWRWLNLDPRVLEDDTAKFDVALWARNSELTITFCHAPKIVTDSFRCEYELDLFDADQLVAASRSFSSSLNNGAPNYEDTGIYLERRAIRALKFFELRVRIEARAVVRLVVEPFP